MLIFTYPTTSEKLDIMLSNDISNTKFILLNIKEKRLINLKKINNKDGIQEITEHIFKLEKARCRNTVYIKKPNHAFG